MLLVASSLALLVIYAGIKLLIQAKRESLNHLFRCAAWFFIIAGFLIIASAGACCIAKCCRYGSHMMHKEHKMMWHDEYGGHESEEMHYRGNFHNMYHHHESDGECKKIIIKCCDGEMNTNCANGMCKTDTTKCKR